VLYHENIIHNVHINMHISITKDYILVCVCIYGSIVSFVYYKS